MRIEKITTGSYVHVYNRGNRKMVVFNDEEDYWRFLLILRYFNNKHTPAKAFQELFFLKQTNRCKLFEWPQKWPPQDPLVKIVAYCLMPNHYHLLLQEIEPGGIKTFMQKLGVGFTNYSNSKHNETGRLFQGPYKYKIINDEEYLQYINAYIQVFNPFELSDDGLTNAFKNFDSLFEKVLDYPFCSLGESFGRRNLSIIDTVATTNKFKSLERYKQFAKDALLKKDPTGAIKNACIDAP